MKARGILAALVLLAITIGVAFITMRRRSAPPDAVPVPTLPTAIVPPAAPTPALQLGPENASIVIEEYSDFQCPYCARAYLATAVGLKAYIARRGDIRYAFYDLAGPTHVHSLAASTAARCAGLQGRFEAAQRLLFEKQRDWSVPDSTRVDATTVVAPLVPDRPAYEACAIEQARVGEILQSNLERALARGVQSTPTLLLIANGRTRLLRGTVDSADLARALR